MYQTQYLNMQVWYLKLQTEIKNISSDPRFAIMCKWSDEYAIKCLCFSLSSVAIFKFLSVFCPKVISTHRNIVSIILHDYATYLKKELLYIYEIRREKRELMLANAKCHCKMLAELYNIKKLESHPNPPHSTINTSILNTIHKACEFFRWYQT